MAKQKHYQKILVTGANGTIGSVLTDFFQKKDVTVFKWDRRLVPITDYSIMEEFIRSIRPDAIFHLAIASNPVGLYNESWLVNYEWTSELAWIARILNIPFIFTSTAMVFSNLAKGPFTPSSIPDAPTGYGYEKRCAEQRVLYQNPKSKIVRLGWQIGNKPGSNNMIDFLDQAYKQNGKIYASREWLPACSFIEDTVQALESISYLSPGIYHVDSNRKWSFYDIVISLSIKHNDRWKVEPTTDFVYDQRLLDDKIKLPDLKKHLKTLPK